MSARTRRAAPKRLGRPPGPLWIPLWVLFLLVIAFEFVLLANARVSPDPEPRGDVRIGAVLSGVALTLAGLAVAVERVHRPLVHWGARRLGAEGAAWLPEMIAVAIRMALWGLAVATLLVPAWQGVPYPWIPAAILVSAIGLWRCFPRGMTGERSGGSSDV